jgi:hypothetical protein
MHNMPPWREYQKENAKTMLRNLNRSTIFKWNISFENFRVSRKFYMFVSLIKFDIFSFFSKYLMSLKRSQHNHTNNLRKKSQALLLFANKQTWSHRTKLSYQWFCKQNKHVTIFLKKACMAWQLCATSKTRLIGFSAERYDKQHNTVTHSSMASKWNISPMQSHIMPNAVLTVKTNYN